MRASSLAPIVVVAALSLAASRRPEELAESEACRVFDSYIAARDRHDPEALAALTSREIRAFDREGNPHPYDEKRLRDVVAWEGVMHARWKGRALAWDGRWLEVEVSEENDLYDALRVGAAVQRDRIRVEHGQIVEWRGLSEHSTGREETAALIEFKKWIESLPAALQEGAVEGGRLLITEQGARKQVILIRRWKREQSPA